MPVALTSWYDDVLPHVPGCVEPVALHAIRLAAIDFCERTWVINDDHSPIDIVADQASYNYVPPTGKLVHKRLEVWYAGNAIIDRAPDQLKLIYGANWQTQAGLPLYHTATGPRAIRLVPIPTEALTGGLTLRVAYKPTQAATTVDDILLEDYREPIANGARMRLMLQAKKPYTNQKQAGIEKEFFDAAVAMVRHQVQRGFGRSRAKTTAHFF